MEPSSNTQSTYYNSKLKRQDMNISKKLLLVLAISITSSVLMAGGGWPQPKGKGYIKLSEWWTISDQHYTDQGRIDPNVTTGIFNTSIYAEYGLTDRLTAQIYFPFFSRTFQNNIFSETTGDLITPGEALNGIGDTDVTLKFGLTNPGSGLAVSTSFTLGLPFGNNSGGSQGNLQLGDGEFNQMIGLDVGTGWQSGNTPFYANANLAFNNRTIGFSDELRYGAELGAQVFNKKLWVIGRLSAVESLKNGDTAATATGTSIFANNTEFLTLGVELAYNLGEAWGVSVGYAGAVRGEVIFASPSYSAGVFTRF